MRWHRLRTGPRPGPCTGAGDVRAWANRQSVKHSTAPGAGARRFASAEAAPAGGRSRWRPGRPRAGRRPRRAGPAPRTRPTSRWRALSRTCPGAMPGGAVPGLPGRPRTAPLPASQSCAAAQALLRPRQACNVSFASKVVSVLLCGSTADDETMERARHPHLARMAGDFWSCTAFSKKHSCACIREQRQRWFLLRPC